MSTAPRFADVVDAADALSEDEQQELIGILQRRMVRRSRERFLQECREADADYAAGKWQPATVEEIMRMTEASS